MHIASSMPFAGWRKGFWLSGRRRGGRQRKAHWPFEQEAQARAPHQPVRREGAQDTAEGAKEAEPARIERESRDLEDFASAFERDEEREVDDDRMLAAIA